MGQKYKVVSVRVQALLLHYDDCIIDPVTKVARGKGCGELTDGKGQKYILFGNQIGGGIYGESPDPKFTQLNRIYLINTIWTRTGFEGFEDEGFFGEFKFRVKTIQLVNGLRPRKPLDRIIEQVDLDVEDSSLMMNRKRRMG